MKKTLFTLLVIAGALLTSCGSNNIKFADEQVEQICLQHWDTDGNGKLSFEEAAAIVQIVHEFHSTPITSFDEFQYFTSVTKVPKEAFADCEQLVSITLPESITSLGESAFYGCTNLTTINIPQGVTSVGVNLFLGCKSLPVVDGISYADCYAVDLVDGTLTNFTLREGTRFVSRDVFDGWADLGYVAIPSIVTKLGNYYFRYNEKLREFTSEEGLTSIGNQAFWECTNLTTVTLPSTLKTIGQFAFFECVSLREVYCKATTPPTLGVSVFALHDYNNTQRGAQPPMLMDNCTFYVPKASVDAYKAAPGWSDYATKIIGYDF